MTTKDKSQISRLVNEGVELNAEIKEKTKRLDEIKKTLAPIANEQHDEHPESNTVVLKGSDGICSVTFATSVKIENGIQADLIRAAIGFSSVVESISYKATSDAAAQIASDKKLRDLVTVTVTPRLSFNVTV